MDMMDRNGQPSMEEILASIRRIIAEEPGTNSHQLIDLTTGAATVHADSALDEPADFELPSMFRVPQPQAPERPTPLFNRLTEAIRAASNTTSAAPAPVSRSLEPSTQSEPSLSSLRLVRGDTATDTSATPTFQLSVFHEQSQPQEAEDTTAPSQPQPSILTSPSQETTPADVRASDVMAPVVPQSPDPAAAFANTPQVPRQMTAFKDTRFSAMTGATPTVATPGFPVPYTPPAAAPAVVAPDDIDLPSTLLGFGAGSSAPAPDVVPGGQPYPLGATDAETSASADRQMVPVAPSPLVPAMPAGDRTQPPPIPDSFTNAPIEDATADLLRPMLRQWLAENMPRMVEKALHIEVAETVKSGRKPGQM